jgi:hypothetical protein
MTLSIRRTRRGGRKEKKDSSSVSIWILMLQIIITVITVAFMCLAFFALQHEAHRDIHSALEDALKQSSTRKSSDSSSSNKPTTDLSTVSSSTFLEDIVKKYNIDNEKDKDNVIIFVKNVTEYRLQEEERRRNEMYASMTSYFHDGNHNYDDDLVSIIIPTYNGSQFIERSVQSVLNQTFPNIEILVSVDFCSLESAEQTIQALQHQLLETSTKTSKLKIFVQKEKLGWRQNTNFLMSQASGQYYAYIADDDLVPTHYIEKLHECHQQSTSEAIPVVLCFPYVQCVGDECDIHLKTKNRSHKLSQKSILHDNRNKRIEEAINSRTALCFMKGLVKRHPTFQNFRYYEMDLTGPAKDSVYADLLQIVKMAIVGKIQQVDVPYYKNYRSNTMSTTELEQRGQQQQQQQQHITNDKVDSIHLAYIRQQQEIAIDLESEIYHTAYVHYQYSHDENGDNGEESQRIELQDMIQKNFQPGLHQLSLSDELYKIVWKRLQVQLRELTTSSPFSHGENNNNTYPLSKDQAKLKFDNFVGRARTKKVAVLGGGIQGVLTALMFRKVSGVSCDCDCDL